MPRSRCALVTLLLLAGCAPGGPPPVKVMALVADASGVLGPRQVELVTVTDPVALKGPLLELVGGTEVRLDDADPLQADLGALDDQGRYQAVVKNTGLPVSAGYAERAGVLWPADFHSWSMVTLYRAYERAQAYFQAAAGGTAPPELQGQRLLYWAEIHLQSATPRTDDVRYLQVLKAIVTTPQVAARPVPLSMNVGVVGHEVAHRVFHARVLSDQGLPAALQGWSGAPYNLLRSLDEGLADFHAHGITCREPSGCQPAFLAPSVADAAEVQARDLSRPGACLDATLRDAFLTEAPGTWEGSPRMYRVGTLWAASLYQVAARTGARAALERMLLLAADDRGSSPGLRQLVDATLGAPGGFTPEAVADVLLAHLEDAGLKEQLCSELLTRLQLDCTAPGAGGGKCAELPHCPTTSARFGGTCPTLDPP